LDLSTICFQSSPRGPNAGLPFCAISDDASSPSRIDRKRKRDAEFEALEEQNSKLLKQVSTLKEISNEQKDKINSLKAETKQYRDVKDLLVGHKDRLATYLGDQLAAAATALNAPGVRNTQHFPKMRAYTHADFLEIIQGEAPELVGLLTSIMDTITGNLEGAKKDRREEIQEHCVANVFAWLLDWADPQFHWQYATGLQLILRKIHRSSYCTDALGFTLPGAPGTVTLTNRINSFSQHQLDQGVVVFDNSVARFGYDNIPGHQGKYYHSSSRGGKDQKRKSTIATAAMVQHYLPPEQENIQKNPHFSPKSDKTVAEFQLEPEVHRLPVPLFPLFPLFPPFFTPFPPLFSLTFLPPFYLFLHSFRQRATCTTHAPHPSMKKRLLNPRCWNSRYWDSPRSAWIPYCSASKRRRRGRVPHNCPPPLMLLLWCAQGATRSGPRASAFAGVRREAVARY
jgi:hypothetical protein